MIFIGNMGKCSLFSYRIFRLIMQQKPLSWHSSIMPKSSTESTRSNIWNPACFPQGKCCPEYIFDTALTFIRSKFKALLPVMPCGLIFHIDIPKYGGCNWNTEHWTSHCKSDHFLRCWTCVYEASWVFLLPLPFKSTLSRYYLSFLLKSRSQLSAIFL